LHIEPCGQGLLLLFVRRRCRPPSVRRELISPSHPPFHRSRPSVDNLSLISVLFKRGTDGFLLRQTGAASRLIWTKLLPLCSVQGQGSMICDRWERCCRGICRVCHQWWGSPLLLYPRGGLTFDALALLRRPQGVRGNASQVLHSFPGAMLKLEDVVE